MGRRVCWSVSQYSGDLVFRHAKPEHALLDDAIAIRASGPPDLYAGRTRQSLPRADQRQSRTVRNYVHKTDAFREMIANIIRKQLFFNSAISFTKDARHYSPYPVTIGA